MISSATWNKWAGVKFSKTKKVARGRLGEWNLWSLKHFYNCSFIPFWFQLLTIVSSFIGTHSWTQAASCLPHCEYPNHGCHTDYQPYKSFDSQPWYTFLSSNFYQFYTYTPGIPISHFVHEYLMSLNVLKISFDFPWFRGPTHSGNAQSFFSVGIPRTVCAFVSLRQDNILQQYIDTFLKTVSPNFIQTASFCRFEKFRIKRNPNRAPLDYPLDLTK